MSNYSKATNFAVKDALGANDPDKIVSGTGIDDEFNLIATSIATKPDANAGVHTGTTTMAAITGASAITSTAFTGALTGNATTATTAGTVTTAAQPAITSVGTLTSLAVAGGITSNSIVVEAFPSGTRMLFQNTNAPPGWTKETSGNNAHDNKALRVVTGTVGTGGQNPFTTTFANRTSDGTELTVANLPVHSHGAVHAHTIPIVVKTVLTSNTTLTNATGILSDTYTGVQYTAAVAGQDPAPAVNGVNYSASTTNTGDSGASANVGGATTHAHTMDLRVQYVDLILAYKN